MSEIKRAVGSLSDYLGQAFTTDSYSLTSNSNLSFHWADFVETCNLYRDMVQREGQSQSAHLTILNNLEKLKGVPIWVKTLDGMSTLSLYDVYESLVTKGRLSKFYVNQANKMVLSFYGPNGPYEVLSPSECVHPERYKEFIFSSLLESKLPTRDFRVRCNGKVLCYFDVCFHKSVPLTVEQITADGILFSSLEHDIQDKIRQSKEIKMLMDLTPFLGTLKKDFNETREYFSDYEFGLFFTRDSRYSYNIQSKQVQFFEAFDHDVTNKTFVFCHFENIKGHQDFVSNVLSDFTNQLKTQIEEEIFETKSA